MYIYDSNINIHTFMYISRQQSGLLSELKASFPIISVTGPRQAGKTTLLRHHFSDYRYVSFEQPSMRTAFKDDPEGFLRTYSNRVIFDEAQNVPELFSYLQGMVDEDRRSGRFILSGSQNFLMRKSITQSLAGRIGIAELLPLDQQEMKRANRLATTPEEAIFSGSYPEQTVNPVRHRLFYDGYLYSYVQRDVAELVSPGNLLNFQRFMSIAAGHAGQLLNYSTMATALGVAVSTVKAWLSILDQSYITFLLPPYFKSVTRRLIKSPKLYFYDTGLLCHLLQLREPSELRTFYMYGSLFENYVVADAMKQELHNGHRPNFHFYRTSNGTEVDLVRQTPARTDLWEIKSNETYHPRLTRTLRRVADTEFPNAERQLIYGGGERMTLEGVRQVPWNALSW